MTVLITVLVPGPLRAKTGGESRLEVELGEAATLGALLDELAQRYPALERRLRDEQAGLRRYVNFYVDGEECRRLDGPSTALRDRGEVQIIPSVAGG
ncbi:Sulfur carrier protein clustered with putative hydrolase SCO1113 [Amycolatopsis camponoti]|uniref:Sulfur carrier protein clustered with putative hydrolase SCO1113 n=1 Tax=Amycolatopsis camponoti TaxID=2606593 RepID=A0A6I8LYQ5_9PSEU|nr:Sulfur carrier protein clustered with putative hydrolase SCO1113 [Amycolatopsis camponoti]